MSESPLDNLSFEQALVELERVVRALEDGQTGLEDALARYEAGIGLLKRCYAQLTNAEQRIRLLSGVDAEGRPVTRPFEHQATVQAKSAQQAAAQQQALAQPPAESAAARRRRKPPEEGSIPF